jgi:hypothetical protein
MPCSFLTHPNLAPCLPYLPSRGPRLPYLPSRGPVFPSGRSLASGLAYLAARLSCIFGENTSPRSARSTNPTARAVAASRAPSLR